MGLFDFFRRKPKVSYYSLAELSDEEMRFLIRFYKSNALGGYHHVPGQYYIVEKPSKFAMHVETCLSHRVLTEEGMQDIIDRLVMETVMDMHPSNPDYPHNKKIKDMLHKLAEIKEKGPQTC